MKEKEQNVGKSKMTPQQKAVLLVSLMAGSLVVFLNCSPFDVITSALSMLSFVVCATLFGICDGVIDVTAEYVKRQMSKFIEVVDKEDDEL